MAPKGVTYELIRVAIKVWVYSSQGFCKPIGPERCYLRVDTSCHMGVGVCTVSQGFCKPSGPERCYLRVDTSCPMGVCGCTDPKAFANQVAPQGVTYELIRVAIWVWVYRSQGFCKSSGPERCYLRVDTSCHMGVGVQLPRLLQIKWPRKVLLTS